jgi:cytochrome c
MAWYLLTGQLDKFVHNLNRLDDFNYKAIPRHYEEAILIYEVLTGSEVNLKGRHISQGTQQRASGFSAITVRFPRGSKEANTQAMLATARDYGDTYFFYYNFGSLLIIKK